MLQGLSHGGETIYQSATPSTELLVGTIKGIVRVERGASGWSVKEITLAGSHVHALLFEPESRLWFAGISHGGIYASLDGGHSWEKRDAGVTENDLYSLARAKVNGKVRLFAGTEPAHLFISDDLGLTWSEKPALRKMDMSAWTFPGPPHIAHLKHITFDPDDSRVLYAGIEQGGLYRSTDGGGSFVEIPGMYIDIHRLVINPRNKQRMYVTGGEGLWTSTDGGAKWNNVAGLDSEVGVYSDQLVFKPSDPDFMIIAAGKKNPGDWHKEHTTLTRISRSRDGGHTWETLRGGLEDHMRDSVEAMFLEESGGTVQIFAATSGGRVLWSENAGDSWSVAVDGLAPTSKGPHYRAVMAAA
ncbi:MAG: hypothetical protein HW395_779 [candidate division NC10 bacterium]|nr:hypothetical protein [candidate division NC10 bacterium]